MSLSLSLCSPYPRRIELLQEIFPVAYSSSYIVVKKLLFVEKTKKGPFGSLFWHSKGFLSTIYPNMFLSQGQYSDRCIHFLPYTSHYYSSNRIYFRSFSFSGRYSCLASSLFSKSGVYLYSFPYPISFISFVGAFRRCIGTGSFGN